MHLFLKVYNTGLKGLWRLGAFMLNRKLAVADPPLLGSLENYASASTWSSNVPPHHNLPNMSHKTLTVSSMAAKHPEQQNDLL